MLENIKSSYICKIIFSYINEKTKLKILKYNKSLQNKLDINLVYYKFIIERFIRYETKDKGEEYNYNNIFLYSGEFLKGRRNGKGKEYTFSCDMESFDGEYLNGKRHGKGKEYIYFGILSFEGEYKNGKKWNGKGYDKEGIIKYEIKNGNGQVEEFGEKTIYVGDYLNGDKNGIGKEFDRESGRLVFKGNYLNGKRNGKGCEYNNCSISFVGEYLNGKRWNGKGYDPQKNVVYELKEGKGYVKEYCNDKISFEGEYLNGERNGKGKEYEYNSFKERLIFEGEYLNGKRIKGKEYDNLFGYLLFEGEYLNNHKRKGKSYIKGKLEFEGEFCLLDKWTGKGFDQNGNILYEINNGTGHIKRYNNDFKLLSEEDRLNGKKHGKVKSYNLDGILMFEGNYINGEKNGKGKNYYYNGELEFEGEYLNGKKWNGKGYDTQKNIIYELK